MCVAVFSPIGTSVPSEEYLSNCFINNPDGAGFAFNLGDGRVQIVKGLMTFDSFIRTFRKYEDKYGFTHRGVLIHFRITTHGGTNPGCCHPFPLTDGEKALRKTKCVSHYAVIHNGIISLCTNEANKRKATSDTMVFIQRYLTKIASNKRWFTNPRNWELIGDLSDSKIAVLNGQGEIRCTSGFHRAEDGNFYSNSSYLPGYGYYGCYGNWNDFYWEGVDDVSLMRLRQGEFVYFDYGAAEEYSDDCPLFLSREGSVYACFDGSDVGTYVNADRLTLIGTGWFVSEEHPLDSDGNVSLLPFRDEVTVFGTDKTIVL